MTRLGEYLRIAMGCNPTLHLHPLKVPVFSRKSKAVTAGPWGGLFSQLSQPGRGFLADVPFWGEFACLRFLSYVYNTLNKGACYGVKPYQIGFASHDFRRAYRLKLGWNGTHRAKDSNHLAGIPR